MKALMDLTLDDVASVYVGRVNRCCCGCSGKHTYNPQHREVSSLQRGYEVSMEECNTATVKRVLMKLRRNSTLASSDFQYGEYYTLDVVTGEDRYGEKTGRMYTVYLLPTSEAIAEMKVRRVGRMAVAKAAAAEALQGAGI